MLFHFESVGGVDLAKSLRAQGFLEKQVSAGFSLKPPVASAPHEGVSLPLAALKPDTDFPPARKAPGGVFFPYEAV